MPTRFAANAVYLVFKMSPVSNAPACRVLGPYHTVRLGAKGIWAWLRDDREPVRVATQANTLCWDLDGIDDPPWGQVNVISPPAGTTAREIEAALDWIRPQ